MMLTAIVASERIRKRNKNLKGNLNTSGLWLLSLVTRWFGPVVPEHLHIQLRLEHARLVHELYLVCWENNQLAAKIRKMEAQDMSLPEPPEGDT